MTTSGPDIPTPSKTGGVAPGMPRRWWLTPPFLILAPAALSFAAWGFLYIRLRLGYEQALRENLTGFAIPATPSAKALLLLLLWYGAVASISALGWRLGSDKQPNHTVAALTGTARFRRYYFLLILTAAALGVGYSYYRIASTVSILSTLQGQTGNDFSDALSASAGPQTLRYATILAAPLGVYLWRKKEIGWPFAAVATVLLVLNAMITSRLALMMAAFVYLSMWLADTSIKKRTTRRHTARWLGVAALLLAMFAVLTALNFFRNANFYREEGISNPLSMNLYQTAAYLAVPAQVSIGVADAIMTGAWEVRGDPLDSLQTIQPTFLQSNKVSKSAGKDPEFYGSAVSFMRSFVTNSAFADIYAYYGLWGWLYTTALYGVAGYLYGVLQRFVAVIAGSAGVLAYAYFEVWRTEMLNDGILIFLLLLTLGSATTAAWLARRTSRPSAQRGADDVDGGGELKPALPSSDVRPAPRR